MAVGDAQFRRKSKAIFDEKLKTSKVILTSHSMDQILAHCQVVVMLADGQATLYEDVKAGIAAYQAYQPPTAHGSLQ
jgi:capsular polysaccharide transport system ATP-binding protein